MMRVNWDDFNRKNRDKTRAFEDMCRILFLRKYKLSSYDYDYNYNQAGLEFEPIYDVESKQWCGAQCKYFSDEANSTKYAQIYKSLKKAFNYYKGKLDVVIIYTNAQLQHICTEEEIMSDEKSVRINIVREARKHNVELIWIQADNLKDELSQISNRDLLNLYFSDSREMEFYNCDITVSEKTFLSSKEFVDLNIKNYSKLSNLKTGIFEEKVNLLLGVAGTGKTLAMKKLYMDFSDDFFTKYHDKKTDDQDVCLPVLIRLRECVNGNLESLMRERLKDYGLNFTESTYEYIYLLDGLDELSYIHLDKVVQFIERISCKNEVKSIVISSRTDSNNLSYLYQKIKCKSYEIEKLAREDIKDYFDKKGDEKKNKYLEELENSNLLDAVDDIFSLNLLWNNIEKIDNKTGKIQFIELSIQHWLQIYSKYEQLPILEPKEKQLLSLCQEIAFEMQKKMLLSLRLSEIQKIVSNHFSLTDATAINNIIVALTDLFFEKSHSTEDVTLSFRHRRFQEYFLYLKVEEEFYKYPNILRQLHLLPNKDFIINVFLKTSLKKAEINHDFQKLFSLRLFEAYLATGYLFEYKDEMIVKENLFGIADEVYTYSKSFLNLLATYSVEDLEILFENRNLCIGNAINNENFLEFIEIYHRANNIDIREFLETKFSIAYEKISYNKNFKSYFYFLHRVLEKSMQEIYNSYIEKYCNKILRITNENYITSGNELVNDFIDLVLEFDFEFLKELLKTASKELLELISYNLLRYKNIYILFSTEEKYLEFRKTILLKIENMGEDIYIHTLVIQNLLSEKDYSISRLEKVFNEINQRNYPTWDHNIELHIALAIILNKKSNCALKEFQLGVEIVETVYKNFCNKNNIIDLWINSIKKFNLIYDDWLKYTHSNILGSFISSIDFDPELIKRFMRKLYKYESVISMQSVLYTIFVNNKEIFTKITNQEFLENIMKYSLADEEEYDSYSESIFQFAAMFSQINVDRKYQLLISGVENGLIRPAYRNEEIATMMIPGCLYFAYQNYWIDDFVLELKCKQLYEKLEILNSTTDGGGYSGGLKWVISECLSNTLLEEELYRVKEAPLYETNPVNDYDLEMLNTNNLEELYNCRVENIPYNSYDFWKQLIEFELSQDESVGILYKVFDDNRFPSSYGFPLVDYIYLPISILLQNEKTKEKIANYLVEKSGRYSIYNMVRVYSVMGKSEEGLELLNFLWAFLEMLIAKEELNINITGEVSETQKYLQICNSTIEEWDIDEPKCQMSMKNNPKITIVWTDFDKREKFLEEWATNFQDSSAYLYEYNLYENNTLIKTFNLVHVDGHRAILPIPKLNSSIVKRDEYLLCRLFNQNIKEYNGYMQRAGLIVE